MKIMFKNKVFEKGGDTFFYAPKVSNQTFHFFIFDFLSNLLTTRNFLVLSTLFRSVTRNFLVLSILVRSGTRIFFFGLGG
jgi:hypothetical protein